MMAAAAETSEEKARRMTEVLKTLRQKAMDLARRDIPEGVILMSDARDDKTYSGQIIGTVSHAGLTLALQRISENQVVRHSITEEERGQLEQIVGRDVTITCSDWHIGRIEDNERLRSQDRVGLGR